MSIHIALHHQTEYQYDRPRSLGPQIIRLRPAPHAKTRVLSYAMRIEPQTHFIHWQQDPYANHQARVVFPERTEVFRLSVDLVLEMAVFNPFDFFLDRQAECFPLFYDESLAKDLLPFCIKCDLTPKLEQRLESLKALRGPTIDCLVQINQDLQRDIAYTLRMEAGVQSPEQTLEQASGSCRDSAWLLVNLLRHLGLAARFVSGYLIQLKPDQQAHGEQAGLAQDFSDLHAWCEVFLPGAGWVGLDPTSGLLAGEGHIPLACTPEPSGAAPVDGAVEASEVQFSHHMHIDRIHESPRVTKPYSDAQWEAINRLGEAVDRRLADADVRLTMGGEPTFVSMSDRDAPEWNTEAIGPGKRDMAIDLMTRMKQRYGAGGFVHLGQGKWYPGEQMPRWALSLFWRKDGLSCWPQHELMADEKAQVQATRADASRLAERLAKVLGFSKASVIPAYEDVFYFLWREGRLPPDVDPFNAKLVEPYERARLRRVFQGSLKDPVGYVVPLFPSEGRWQSSPWTLRDDRLYLTPGDSPIGYRLPLQSLARSDQDDALSQLPLDPFNPGLQTALPPFQTALDSLAQEPGNSLVEPAREGFVGTALCVEVRNPGRSSGPEEELAREGDAVVYVFMPPVQKLEDYLSLLAAVHHAAQSLSIPVLIEGYPPPKDPRLAMLQITPDPGVIEVNIHPASDWPELVERTEFLYEAARQSGLSAEKFMLDGRHTGTGGGNHLVMGAAKVEDSPFLRRPDLLASLISFWHNHPSLSYLFSGLFIGPGSQAPRVDEARNDQVYELEIALREIERAQSRPGPCAPWLIDRCLRNLLIDVTGNTHRAEFCIDKLFAPDGPNGRMGLLEMRAFEMPPHPRMSLVQQLLLRACIAWFWQQPYRSPRAQRLTRWGTGLHDRFLLPTFIRLDFEDVLSELRHAGFDFELEWFEPQLEFRFPNIGSVAVRGVAIELRHALEPWQVIGESVSVSGTSRYVDASLERIEVLAQGIDSNRYVLSINGRSAPLQPTGRDGEAVIGVRFKAWQQAFALHPSIDVHTPIHVDLVDNLLARSMGGCRYHVAHPGGRNYERLPINAYEAESRRLSRFFREAHTPGLLKLDAARQSLEFPFTMDLRQYS